MVPETPVGRWTRQIRADHSQYLLVVDNDPLGVELQQDQRNWLVDGQDGLVTVTTATEDGPVRIELEALQNRPEPDPDDWDDVVEIGVTSTTGCIQVSTLLEGSPPRMPNLATAGRGAYRIQVSVRGRDEVAAAKGTEAHRIQCWPTSAPETTAPVAHKLTDKFGRGLRGELAPPPLRPWEIAGIKAMHGFVEAMQKTAADADEDVTTVVARADLPFSRRRVFTQLTALSFLIGDGGLGGAYSPQGAARVFATPGSEWVLWLYYEQTSSTSPGQCSWDTYWATQVTPWPPPASTPRGSVAFELTWARPTTTVEVTHTGIPSRCAEPLAGLWDYWLAQLANRLGPNDCAFQPWRAAD